MLRGVANAGQGGQMGVWDLPGQWFGMDMQPHNRIGIAMQDFHRNADLRIVRHLRANFLFQIGALQRIGPQTGAAQRQTCADMMVIPFGGGAG